MKTKTKMLLVIGLLAALCVGFLIGIAVDYPPSSKSELAGTFGKSEKYHKVQMTANDIQLRSELVKDSAQLRSMIQGLIYFSMFTEEVCANIDLSVSAFKSKGMGAVQAEADAVKSLQDYSDFIRNNNKTLNSTITMLTGFFQKDSADQSLDVEKNLREFGTYVNGLVQKNKVLSQALAGMDNFMLTNKTLQAHKTEITQLKSIRDQLLIKGVQLGSLIGSSEQVSVLVLLALTAQDQFSAITASDQLSAVNGKPEIGYSMTGTDIQAAITGHSVDAVFSTGGLTGTIVGYSATDLSFACILGTGKLDRIVTATSGIGSTIGLSPVVVIGKETVSAVLGNYSVQNVIQANVLDAASVGAVASIFGLGNLTYAFSSSEGLSRYIGVAASSYIGSVEQ